MYTFDDAILVKLLPSTTYIRVKTIDRTHGKNGYFYLDTASLIKWRNGDMEDWFLDLDSPSFVQMYRVEGHGYKMVITWLKGIGINNSVTGFRQYIDIPEKVLDKILCGEDAVYLSYNDPLKSNLVLMPSGQYRASVVCRDKLVKRALCKALRNNLRYPDSSTFLYSDFGKDFSFETDTMYGGLVYSLGYVRGKDGKRYPRVKYSVHT